MGLADNIQKTYAQAAKEVKKKLDEYTKHYQAQIAVMQKRLESGKISQEDYNDWLERQIFRGKRWQEKLDDITKTYVDADGTARELVGDRSKNVFARFANSTARDIQNRFNGGVSFDMYDRHAVERLLKENSQMLPEWKINEKKDYRWNAQRVQNAITQGIIQGEGIPQLAKRLTSELSASNARHMTLFARTAMTGAQNAGRVERLHEAQDMGIVVKKKWLTAGDDDVRDAHKDLNGVEVGVDEKFKVMVKGKEYEIDYPGDPTADPALVYNCRCTLTYVYDVKASRENLQEKEQRVEETQVTTTVVQGQDITGTWQRRPEQFDFEIEDIISAQGFDGKPRVVGAKEFDEYVEESGIIMQRGYTAPDSETLSEYEKSLYDGEWYINNSRGAAQHGRGMYSVYTKGTSLTEEMKSAAESYAHSSGTRVGKIETFTLTKDARIISYEDLLKEQREWSTSGKYFDLASSYARTEEERAYIIYNAGGRRLLSDSQIKAARRFEETVTEKRYYELEDAIKAIQESKIGTSEYAVLRGYDAVMVEDSGYMIILNRTKCIFRRR